MFRDAIAEHKKSVQELSARADQLQTEAKASAQQFASVAVDCLNADVREVYENQKDIEQETQRIKEELRIFQDQGDKWGRHLKQLQHALKELGLVDNYIAAMEAQAVQVAALSDALCASADPSSSNEQVDAPT